MLMKRVRLTIPRRPSPSLKLAYKKETDSSLSVDVPIENVMLKILSKLYSEGRQMPP